MDLKLHSNLTYPDVQAEDQSEGHHRFPVHWSGGIFLDKHKECGQNNAAFTWNQADGKPDIILVD